MPTKKNIDAILYFIVFFIISLTLTVLPGCNSSDVAGPCTLAPCNEPPAGASDGLGVLVTTGGEEPVVGSSFSAQWWSSSGGINFTSAWGPGTNFAASANATGDRLDASGNMIPMLWDQPTDLSSALNSKADNVIAWDAYRRMIHIATMCGPSEARKMCLASSSDGGITFKARPHIYLANTDGSEDDDVDRPDLTVDNDPESPEYGTAYISLTRHEGKIVKLYRCRDVEGKTTGGRPLFEQIYMVANNNDPLGAIALRLGPTVRTGTRGALFFAYRYMTALDDSIVLKATPPPAARLSPDATADAFSEVAELDYARLGYGYHNNGCGCGNCAGGGQDSTWGEQMVLGCSCIRDDNIPSMAFDFSRRLLRLVHSNRAGSSTWGAAHMQTFLLRTSNGLLVHIGEFDIAPPPDKHYQFQPRVAIHPNGQTFVSWGLTTDSTSSTLDMEGRVLTPSLSGSTFVDSVPFKLTQQASGSTSTHPRQITTTNGCFMGDYHGLAGANGTFVAAWTAPLPDSLEIRSNRFPESDRPLTMGTDASGAPTTYIYNVTNPGGSIQPGDELEISTPVHLGKQPSSPIIAPFLSGESDAAEWLGPSCPSGNICSNIVPCNDSSNCFPKTLTESFVPGWRFRVKPSTNGMFELKLAVAGTFQNDHLASASASVKVFVGDATTSLRGSLSTDKSTTTAAKSLFEDGSPATSIAR